MKNYFRGFWLGWILAISSLGIFQDWLGKEAYLSYANHYWINTHWSFWLLPIAFAFVAFYPKRRRG